MIKAPIFLCATQDVMYLHVDPEGVLNTSSAVKDLAELIAAKVGKPSFSLLF